MKMKMKIILPHIRSDYQTGEMHSSFLVKTTNDMLISWARTNLNHMGEVTSRCRRTGTRHYHDEHYWNQIADTMHRLFMHLGRTEYAKSSEMTYITFRYKDGDATIILRKDGNKYILNGVKKNQKDVAMALAKIIAFGAQNRSCRLMNQYMERNILYSSNILHALENRTPYWFYVDGRKTNVKINTKLIGQDEIAFEISENIWASTDLNNANIFIDCYKNGATRSKRWANISPSNLWYNLFETHPTEAEMNMMTAWLLQNRTDVIVEERAFELLENMDKTYDEISLVNVKNPVFSPDELKGLSERYDFGLLIHGSLGDWLVYPNSRGGGSQRCSAVFYGDDGKIHGPFCIDDVNSKNVTGDQIATRAMLLKNDKMALQMVSTLREVKSTNFRLSKRLINNAKYVGKPNLRGV